MLDYFKKSALSSDGRLLMNCFSSSNPNFFFILSDSSMKLHSLYTSSYSILFSSTNRRMILKFLFFSVSCCLMLVIRLPTQLIL